MTDEAHYSPYAWRMMAFRAIHAHADRLGGFPCSDMILVAWHYSHSAERNADRTRYAITPRRGARRKLPVPMDKLAPLAEVPGITQPTVALCLELLQALGLMVNTRPKGNGSPAEWAYSWPAREALDTDAAWKVALAAGLNPKGKRRDTKRATSRSKSAAILRKAAAQTDAEGAETPGSDTSRRDTAVTRHDATPETRHDATPVTRHDASPLPIGVSVNRIERDPLPPYATNGAPPGTLTDRANSAAQLGSAGRRTPPRPAVPKQFAHCICCGFERRIHDTDGRCADCLEDLRRRAG